MEGGAALVGGPAGFCEGPALAARPGARTEAALEGLGGERARALTQGPA